MADYKTEYAPRTVSPPGATLEDFLARRAEQKPLPGPFDWGNKSPDLRERYT